MQTTVKIDMTTGNLLKKILLFSLPLVASGILQQSFNAIDVVIVGRYCSHQALAAVGSNGPVINILINLFIGISIGSNVIISNYIGCKNNSGIKKAISTTMTISVISGIALAILGFCLAEPILQFMRTPGDVMPLATEYLQIFFLGMPMFLIYNFGAAVMRSMGDTRRPFISLVIAGICNIILNLIFVTQFDMGVKGVAIATLISSTINCIFILWWLTHEESPFTLNIKSPGIDTRELTKMLRIGIPAGMQGMVFSIANIFIQSSINQYGSAAAAGSAAALNYEVYCYFIMIAFCQAATAFISQNYGAKQYKRCLQTFYLCMAMSVVSVGLANLIIVLNGKFFLSIFSTDSTVIGYGLERLKIVLSLQFIASSYEISGSCLRGLGNSITPMVLTVIGTCVLRLVWVHTISLEPTNFPLLLSVYPLSWLATGTAVTIAFIYVAKKKLKPERD